MTETVLDQQPRILVVDDDSDQLALVSRLLEHAGFLVQTAGDALTGFELAQRTRPDLVISDVTMPEVSGIEFCNMIRAHESLFTTPILLVSGIQKDTETIVEGLHTGADDYLEIPYEPTVLVAKAIRLIEVNRVVEDLQKEKACLRYAIAAAKMGLWDWNIRTGKVSWSEDLERIHGLAPGDFAGTLESFFNLVHADDRDLVRSAIACTLDEEREHDIEYRIVWPNNSIHWVAGRGGLIRNHGGKPVKMVGLCMDITARKESEGSLQTAHDELEKRVEERTLEHKQLEEQLLQSQKLEAVGRLAGGLAHDFNNLLTAIIGYSQLSLRRLAPEDPLRTNLEEIRKAGDRAASLTRQILAFSRKQVMQPIVLDLNSVISELERMLRRMIGEDIELRTAPQADLGAVKAGMLTDPAGTRMVIDLNNGFIDIFDNS